jgi:hypothetical protein
MFSAIFWILVLCCRETLQSNEPGEIVLEDLSVEVTEENWSNTFAENTKQLLLVEFYSPLCGMNYS